MANLKSISIGQDSTPIVDAYSKSETDNLLAEKQDTLTASDNIKIESNIISLENVELFPEIINQQGTEQVPTALDIYKVIYTADKEVHFFATIQVIFQANANGSRAVYIKKSKPGEWEHVPRRVSVDATSRGVTALVIPLVDMIGPGETIEIVFWQNSGGALNVEYDITGLFYYKIP